MADYARMTKRQLIERLEKLNGQLGASQRVKGGGGSKKPAQLPDDEPYEILTKEILKESEKKYRAIFEEIQDGYWETDLTGRLTFVNDAMCRIAGATKDELLNGVNFSDYAKPETEKRIYKIFEEVYRTGKPSEIGDHEVTRRNGSIGVFQFNVSLIRNDTGQPVGFRGITRDVTERRAMEAALRESEESHRNILALAPDAISIVRQEDATYLQVNDAFCRQTGYSADEIIGRTSADLNLYVDPADRRRLLDILAQEGQVDGIEIQYRAKDGTILDDLLSARRIQFRGEDCFLIVATVITSLKEAQKSLRQSEERYRTILDTIEEGYFENDLAGNYIFVNDAMCRIMGGYTKEEIIGMNNRAYTDSKTAKNALLIFSNVYKTGRPANIKDYEVRKKDGSVGIRELHVSLMHDPDGKPIGFRGLSRDVTERRQAERVLRESEERYRTILEDINEGYYELDLAGAITFVNEAGARILGFTRKELIGMNNQKRITPEMAAQVFKIFNKVYRTGKPADISGYEIIAKDGSPRILSMHISLMYNSEGSPVGFRGVSRDVTQQKQAERALQESEERYRNLFEKTASPIMITDPEGRFIDWNDAALAFLECTRNELVKRNVHDFLPSESREAARKKEKDSWRLDRTGEAEYLIGEKIKILELSMTPAVLNGKDVVFGVGKDVTERKQAEERLAYMATHDQLTGLPNRALFGDRLELELEKSRRNNKMLAVILFDLDRFKEVNDTLGHGVGDLLLKELGHRLKGCLRKSDTVARMGGDEFFMLLCDIKSENDADIIADKILEAIRRPFTLGSNKIHVTASLGVAFYPKDGNDVETLIQKADIAMYEAKESGRDHYGHYLPLMGNVKP